jgi:hypothetical protein
MKRYISYLVLFFAAAVSVQAQATPDAAKLTDLLNEFLAGAGRNDAAVHDRFWADDLIYTRSAGVRIGKEELMKGVRSAPAPKPGDPVSIYSAEEVKINQYGNAAVVAFKLVGTTTKSDGSKTVSNFLNTGTFIKRNGKWQAVAWQATIIPDAETKSASQAPPVASPVPLTTAATAGPVTQTPAAADGARVYLNGSRGGCYYLNSSGKKVYVSHDLCK